MSNDQSYVARWQAAEEGQFFERKSALDRSGGTSKPRKTAMLKNTAFAVLVDERSKLKMEGI